MKSSEVVAVVTGGASGLGAATAARLVAAGAKVAVLDLPSSPGAQLVSTLGEAALFTPADVTSESEVTAALEATRTRLGPVNVLVNSAGIGVSMNTLGFRGPAKLEDFARVIHVNLVGTFNCIRLAAAHMSRNRPNADGERGVIVNTSSAAAFDGQVGQVAYAASKAGIVGMTLPLARDLAELGIRVVTLAPGLFDTPMLSGLAEPVRASLVKQPLFPQRLGRPEEFAALVQHVLENVMLNAETIRLDGGIRMPPR
ncbi:3-hydroxyacyl-CoA dehydrogenase [Archangium sp.]|jgi:NAD(P)-dependent dehydrogenase (short-subunit alcohol dehydrogenase family)|uniref:3-hydroxyacyl-CoA dehydrogenase n=1 Tax=Archangium sp. TaxID=1872627 RepID=UPI002ED81C5B